MALGFLDHLDIFRICEHLPGFSIKFLLGVAQHFRKSAVRPHFSAGEGQGLSDIRRLEDELGIFLHCLESIVQSLFVR